jgi:cytochrome c553
MKKITVLSLVAATVLFTACGEKTTDAANTAADAVTTTVDATATAATTTKATTDAAEATKKAAADAAAKVAATAAAAKAATEKKAADAAAALKERAAATTEAVTGTTENVAGKAVYAKCAGCHGADGKTKALGKSAVVAGQATAALVASLQEYKAGTKNVSGMGMLMKGQVASMDEATMTAVSEYMSGL